MNCIGYCASRHVQRICSKISPISCSTRPTAAANDLPPVAGLVPATHVFAKRSVKRKKAWMAGPSPTTGLEHRGGNRELHRRLRIPPCAANLQHKSLLWVEEPPRPRRRAGRGDRVVGAVGLDQ